MFCAKNKCVTFAQSSVSNLYHIQIRVQMKNSQTGQKGRKHCYWVCLCPVQHTKLICPCLWGCLIQASCYSCQLNTQKQHRPRQFYRSCCQCSIMQVWLFVCCMNSLLHEFYRDVEGKSIPGGRRAQSVSQHPDKGEPWLGPVDNCGQGCLSWTQQQRLHPQMHSVRGWVTHLFQANRLKWRTWGRLDSYEPSAQAELD